MMLNYKDPLWNIYTLVDNKEEQKKFLDFCLKKLNEDIKQKIFSDSMTPKYTQ